MADVTDPTHEPESYADLPMQPTGSGPADLEVAYEQMRLAEEAQDTTGGVPAAAVTDAAVPVSDRGRHRGERSASELRRARGRRASPFPIIS